MTTMPVDTKQLLRQQCSDILNTLSTLDTFEDSFYDFINNVLEVTASGTFIATEGWKVDTVDLLLAFGGPTIRAKIDPESYSVEVLGQWGTDFVRLYGEVGDALTEWAREYAEQMEGV